MMTKREEQLIAIYKELKSFDLNYKVNNLCGLDEAGRGPMMGPVVAAAVVLGDEDIIGLNDSKKISEKKRMLLADEIKQKAKAWGVGVATSDEIDEVGIQKANYLAFERAFMEIKNIVDDIDHVIIDGNYKNIEIESHEMIVKGDTKSACIAAASILAKTERDKYIVEVCHKEFPQYNFLKNKGYGTLEHREAILKYGLCPYHRKSFCKNYI